MKFAHSRWRRRGQRAASKHFRSAFKVGKVFVIQGNKTKVPFRFVILFIFLDYVSSDLANKVGGGGR